MLTTLDHPAEMPVYKRLPLRPVRGRGCELWDADGRAFLDFYGGHAVAVTGHCHPRVVAALHAQVDALLFYSNALPIDARDALYTKLAALAPEPCRQIFLVSSGAEANEQAIALARRATGRATVVVFDGGFHGRTLATLALSGMKKYRALAEATDAGRALTAFTRVVPWNDLAALEAAVDESVAAVFIEPVQGLGGARDADPALLQRARELCDQHGAALVFDEVQCGCGRTGAFTAAQSYGVMPDALSLAKGLGAGLPIGAVLASPRLVLGLRAGDLGTTFGGGPVACAAAAANLDVLVEERLAERAVCAFDRLARGAATIPGVERVQGRGLLLGLVLDRDAASVERALFERGILTGNAADPRVLRLLPPLVLEDAQIDIFLRALAQVLA